MPVSVIVGGQYGSEGKGKVALELARRDVSATCVVRSGGTNSGHTAYDQSGKRFVLRQLPAAAVDRNVHVVLPAGSYIDVDLLGQEIAELGLGRSQVTIDPRAHIIRPEHVAWEVSAGLTNTIGSTGSGTGAAVLARIARLAPAFPSGLIAAEVPQLFPYLGDTTGVLRDVLSRGERVLVEGTQGFGLSPIHGDVWPRCTSRDTTAAAFLSEAGLSPFDVDQIILVIRCHPIRVAGDSGPLIGETDWAAIAEHAGAPVNLSELTSVTQKIRRVGKFDAGLVRRAIEINKPTTIVLNHVDYVDWESKMAITAKAEAFVSNIENAVGQSIDWCGLGPKSLVRRATVRSMV